MNKFNTLPNLAQLLIDGPLSRGAFDRMRCPSAFVSGGRFLKAPTALISPFSDVVDRIRQGSTDQPPLDVRQSQTTLATTTVTNLHSAITANAGTYTGGIPGIDVYGALVEIVVGNATALGPLALTFSGPTKNNLSATAINDTVVVSPDVSDGQRQGLSLLYLPGTAFNGVPHYTPWNAVPNVTAANTTGPVMTLNSGSVSSAQITISWLTRGHALIEGLIARMRGLTAARSSQAFQGAVAGRVINGLRKANQVSFDIDDSLVGAASRELFGAVPGVAAGVAPSISAAGGGGSSGQIGGSET
jgi:hypothetical protein